MTTQQEKEEEEEEEGEEEEEARKEVEKAEEEEGEEEGEGKEKEEAGRSVYFQALSLQTVIRNKSYNTNVGTNRGRVIVSARSRSRRRLLRSLIVPF